MSPTHWHLHSRTWKLSDRERFGFPEGKPDGIARSAEEAAAWLVDHALKLAGRQPNALKVLAQAGLGTPERIRDKVAGHVVTLKAGRDSYALQALNATEIAHLAAIGAEGRCHA